MKSCGFSLKVMIAGAIALLGVACRCAESRVALVIGNGAYGAGQELANPPNDAGDVAACLRELDFSVTVETNLNLGGMQDAVLDFSRALKPGDVALFFYAGHGLQAEGRNFLVPVGARIREAFEVASQAYEANQVLGAMEQAGAGLKVMVLDCCRDNPVQRSWSRGATSRGLAMMSVQGGGTLIAFSTAEGKTAADGTGRNSPYSAALVRTLRSRPREGLEISELFREAAREVKSVVGQEPWLSLAAAMEKYYLIPPARVVQHPEVARGSGVTAGGFNVPGSSRGRPWDASPEQPFVNSLGMRFVPLVVRAPGANAPILMSAFETRVRDYEAFASATGGGGAQTEFIRQDWEETEGIGRDWRNPGFSQGPDHPVVGVSWEDAAEFCRWLTRKERGEGILSASEEYRLSSDMEWSVAAGLEHDGALGGSGITYPWGSRWPPPAGVGNYCGMEVPDDRAIPGTSLLEGYRDNFPRTAPAGSFSPNGRGLYDLGGNVWEMCADWFTGTMNMPSVLAEVPNLAEDGGGRKYRVLRGGSWGRSGRMALSSQYRGRCIPNQGMSTIGFRCVLAAVGTGGDSAPERPVSEGGAAAAVRAFVEKFIRAGSSDQPALAQLPFFAERVNHFKNGNVDRAFIQKDLCDYAAKWSKRDYAIEGAIKVEASGHGMYVCTFVVRHVSENNAKKLSGMVRDTITVQGAGEGLQITSIVSETVNGLTMSSDSMRLGPASAARERPFVNSLGMEFVPVPEISGVLMCRIETRVKEFRRFALDINFRQTGGALVFKLKKNEKGGYSAAWDLDSSAGWEDPGFRQGEDHPVVCVSWEEAKQFCRWLSEKEGRQYRLPSDAEWSASVGEGKYPWGRQWPPPKNAGNYWDKQAVRQLPGRASSAIEGFDDGAERTAAAGSYPENKNGFCDLGGNVWEWCEDFYTEAIYRRHLEGTGWDFSEHCDDGVECELNIKKGDVYRVLRGGSWANSEEIRPQTSYRNYDRPACRYDNVGFRCVLVVGP